MNKLSANMSFKRAFDGIVSGSLGLFGLASHDNEMDTQQSDRLMLSNGGYSTTVDQAAVAPVRVGEHRDETFRSALDVAGDRQTVAERYYLVHHNSWTTSQVLGTSIGQIEFPHIFQSDLYAINGLLKYHQYVRYDLEVVIQINPTSFQNGGLLAWVEPATTLHGGSPLCNCPTFPSGFLNCNVNNMVTIKVPFTYTRNQYQLHNNTGPDHVHTLNIAVWEQLKVASGTSTICDVRVLARMCNVQLHGIRPAADATMRAQILPVQVVAGQGVINTANQSQLVSSANLALGDEELLVDSSFAGGLRCTNLDVQLRTPCRIKNFSWSTTSSAGTQLCKMPVGPWQTAESWGHVVSPCNLTAVSQFYRYWRGDIIFTTQFFPTKYHSGRVIAVFIPGPEEVVSTTQPLEFLSTCMNYVFDLGVQSTMAFRVPYISAMMYENVKGAVCTTGWWYLYVYTQLAAPNNVSTEVGCVVNVSAGENFELYVPSYNLPQAGDQDPGDMVTDVVPQQVDAPTPAPTDMAVVKSGPAGSLEMPQYKPSTTGTFPELKDGKRLHTRSHTDLRNLLGRAQYATEFVYSNAQYINYNYQVNINAMKGVMGSIMQMFTFFRGRLKLVVMVETASSVDVSISFRPLDASSINTFEDSARYGMARISTDQTTQVTVTLPWYTKLSALGMQSTDGFFGYVHFYGRVGGATTFKLLLAFDETSSLYFPRACPIGSYYKPAITTRDAAFIHQVDAPVVSARPRMVIQGSDGDPVAYLCYVQRLMYKHYFVEINTGELIGFRVIGTGPGRYFGLGMVVYEKPTVVAGYIREQVIYEDLTYLHDMVGRTCKYNALTYNCEHWARQHCFLRCESLQQDKVAAAAFGMTAGALNMLAQGGDDKDVKPKSKQGLMGMVTGASKLADSMETFPASMSKHIETTVELSLGKISDTIVRTVNDSFADISLTSDIASMAQEVRDVAAEIKNAKLSQLTSVVGDAACSSSANVNVTAQQMGEAAASISKLSDQVRDILQRATGGPLKSKYGSKIASKVMKWFTRLAQSFVVVYLCYKNPIPTVLVPVSVYMGLGVFGKLFGMLGDRLMCRAQSADNEEDEQAVMDILSSMVYEAVAQAVPAKFHPEGGCTGFVQQIRTAGLVSTALKSIIGMVAFVVNAIKKAVSYFVPDEKCKASRKLVEHRSSMLGWCVRANRLLASINDNDKDLPRKYATLAADGEKYLAWFLLAGDQAADSKLYRRICELLNKMDMCVTPAIRDEACIARVEPVVVYFYGEKGVGKSVATFSLAAQICKEMGWDPFTNIYTKPVSAQYYDGYKQQKVMIIDDMGQCSDGRDYEDFCQIVSSAPLRLNMAHLSNKGTHFTTPFIIVSSNVPIPRPASVVCPAAINRRLELKYEVKPADPYKTADGLLDFGAAKTAGTLKKATCLVFKHHDNNALNTQTAGVPKTMDQIVLAVIQKLTAKSSNFQDIMQMFVQGKGDERNWTDSSYHQYCESIRLQRTAEGSWDPLAEDDDDDTGYSSEDMSSIGDIIQEEIMPKWKMVLIGIATAVATVSALTAAAFGIHKLVEHHKKKKEGGTQAAYAPTTQAPVRKLHRAPPVQQQGSNEVIRIVQKNLVQLGYVKHNTIHYVLNAIFTHDNQLLVPYHFFHYATNHNIVIRDPSSVIENEYEQGALKVVRLEHEGKPLDACLITVPNRQPSRDIRKHFVRRDDLGKVPGTNAILATIVGQNFTLVPETELTMKSEASYGMAEQTCVTSDVIMATASTGIGFCGGALISNLTTIQNAILGVHVAGNGMMAFTQIITVEMLNTPMVAEGRIQTVKPGPQIGTPTKTAFSVSPLAEYFESGKEPAALGCKDRRVEVDPFAVALEKYGSALKAPPHDWKECVDGVSQLMVDRVGCIDGDLSTFDAINGIPGLDAVNMKTSAGWPWVGVGKSKRDLIETHVQNGKQVLIPTPELNEALEEHEETIENAGPIDIKYVTYFKDELRPTSKIRQGKTRIIESAPVHHVVAFRKVFGRAIARLHQSDPFVSGLAVGMDVDQDFSALHVKMAMFGEQLFDLDYTCFDGRLQPFVISAAFRILARLANVSEFVGDAYAQRLIHSFHLFQGLEIEVIGGMPSGSPATTIINSICNQLMVYYVLARCLGCPLFQVFDHVRPIVYGDDVLLVVKHGVSANLEDLPSVMLDVFGAVVTDASKSGKPYVKSIDQVTFLKRSFVVDKSVYLVVHPAIDKCTIEAMLQYQRKGEKYPDRIDAALWMAYHHGEDVYNRYVHRIRVACAHVGYRYDNIPRFEEMNTIMMKKIFG